MTNKTVTLDLSSGGGRQTLPAWDNTNVEITTTWSNGKSASDDSLCIGVVHVSWISAQANWTNTDDWEGWFSTDLATLSQPDVYVDGVLYSNIINYFGEENEGEYEILLLRSELPEQEQDYDIVLSFHFSTGDILTANVHVTGNP